MKSEDNILKGINRPSTKNVEEMSDLEKKHTIIIKAPEEVRKNQLFEVEARLGEYKEHPNKLTHFIEWMELYQDKTFLSRLNLTPEKSHHIFKATIKVDEEQPLRVRAKCNKHGVWESEKQIKLK